jgi:hypothetical protein
VLEVGDGFLQAIGKCHLRLPVQNGLRLGKIGLALPRIVLWQRLVDQLRAGSGEADDFLRQFQNREFRIVAEIDRSGAALFVSISRVMASTRSST